MMDICCKCGKRKRCVFYEQRERKTLNICNDCLEKEKKEITKTTMRTRRQIEDRILKFYNEEKLNGNSRLIESRISPRRQGKIRALRWCLGDIEEI